MKRRRIKVVAWVIASLAMLSIVAALFCGKRVAEAFLAIFGIVSIAGGLSLFLDQVNEGIFD